MEDQIYYADSAEELQALSREISDNIHQFTSSEPYKLYVGETETKNPVDMKDFVDVLQYLHSTYPITVSYDNPYWVVSCNRDCKNVVKSSVSYLVYHYEVAELVVTEDTVKMWLYPHCYQAHSSRYMKSALSLYDSDASGTIDTAETRNEFLIQTDETTDPIYVNADKSVEDLKKQLNRKTVSE
jgi:hypothetical protein